MWAFFNANPDKAVMALLGCAALCGFLSFKIGFDRTNAHGVAVYRSALGAMFGGIAQRALRMIGILTGFAGTMLLIAMMTGK